MNRTMSLPAAVIALVLVAPSPGCSSARRDSGTAARPTVVPTKSEVVISGGRTAVSVGPAYRTGDIDTVTGRRINASGSGLYVIVEFRPRCLWYKVPCLQPDSYFLRAHVHVRTSDGETKTVLANGGV